jgi:hypothetical protein
VTRGPVRKGPILLSTNTSAWGTGVRIGDLSLTWIASGFPTTRPVAKGKRYGVDPS